MKPSEGIDLLKQAHRRAQRLVEDLRKQQAELEGPSPRLSRKALAAGRERVERAMEAARRTAQRLEEALSAAAGMSDRNQEDSHDE